jgi:hypothetical protein
MTETYEQLRDSATGEAGDAWRRKDRAESELRTLYSTLKEDPRYTEEHKAEQAWQRYEAVKEKIGADTVKAREGLAKQVRSGERFSIPMPEGESLVTTDTAKLLASQNEASRIVRKLDRLAGSGAGPFKRNPAEVLKSEYERGLQIGGVQGGAICRGVLKAADELGVDKDQVVDGFRKRSHRSALEDAERASRLTQHISRSVPEPPFPDPRLQRVKASRGSVGAYGGGQKALVPNTQSALPKTPQSKRRRPSWK